ncbi:MAG: flavin reductase family protein [Armatimonadetes bacterium]|nr:flavin reductase family protein [Armatimonadota bacterium]
MAKIQHHPTRPIYPTPVGLITSCDAEGNPNIITLGEVFNLSIKDPVWVGLAIRKATYSHGLISQQKEFVVNLPTTALLDQALQCGSVSGRDGVNKFEEFGLTPVAAQQVEPPLIGECPINLECRLVNIVEVGDHDLFIGEVLVEHVEESLFDEQGQLALEKLDPIVMMRWGFCRVGERIIPDIK